MPELMGLNIGLITNQTEVVEVEEEEEEGVEAEGEEASEVVADEEKKWMTIHIQRQRVQ